MADIRADHGWSSSQAGVLRQRLMDAGLIVGEGYGVLGFALPGIAQVLADEL